MTTQRFREHGDNPGQISSEHLESGGRGIPNPGNEHNGWERRQVTLYDENGYSDCTHMDCVLTIDYVK